MVKKKNRSTDLKTQRRIFEAEKASLKTRARAEMLVPQMPVAKISEVSGTHADRYSLPVAAIKRDLIKNGLFMVFALVILFALKVSGLNL